jgi:hypothetical protein
MDSKKTIQINPNLFTLNEKGGGKTRKKKERKRKPILPVKPNTLRKKLLGRIKDFQKQENETHIQENEVCVQESKKISSVNTLLGESKEFAEEFDKSLNFLQELSKKRKNEKYDKSQKKQKKRRAKQNQTLKRNIPNQNNVSSISLNLPSELQGNEIDLPPPSPGVGLSLQKSFHEINHTPPPEVPYGCLKNGSKPTYRTWKKMTQKNKHHGIQIEEPLINTVSNIREKKLEEIKNRSQLQRKSTKISTTMNKQQKPSTVLHRKTTIKTYTLGKVGKKIGVLIKNRHTRRKIAHEQTLLKKKSILEVKNYLRKHQLLKAGSDSPNDVLRKMYEQAVLCGDIHNTSKDVLLHNYLNNE